MAKSSVSSESDFTLLKPGGLQYLLTSNSQKLAKCYMEHCQKGEGERRLLPGDQEERVGRHRHYLAGYKVPVVACGTIKGTALTTAASQYLPSTRYTGIFLRVSLVIFYVSHNFEK